MYQANTLSNQPPLGFPRGSAVKNPPVMQKMQETRVQSSRSPGGGHGNPLQYSCLENPMDRGAWQAVVHRVAKSWTWLKQLNMHTSSYIDKYLSSNMISPNLDFLKILEFIFCRIGTDSGLWLLPLPHPRLQPYHRNIMCKGVDTPACTFRLCSSITGTLPHKNI